MQFSAYDSNGLRLLSPALSEAMVELQQTIKHPLDEAEKAAFSNRLVDNLSKAYDAGVLEPSALKVAALRAILQPVKTT